MDYVHHLGEITYSSDMPVRYDADAIYVRWAMPWRDEPMWIRVPLDSSAPDPLDLQGRALENPIGLLASLTGAGDDVRTVGSEEVRGTATTHYEGTLELANRLRSISAVWPRAVEHRMARFLFRLPTGDAFRPAWSLARFWKQPRSSDV